MAIYRQVSLRTALYIADRIGYNLISFGNVFIFPPLKDELRKTLAYHRILVHHLLIFLVIIGVVIVFEVKTWKPYESQCEQRAQKSHQ